MPVTIGGITLKQRTENSWEIPKEGGMLVPGRVYVSRRMLDDLADDRALEQVRNVAHLPGILGCSIGMPDIHWGYGFPIGGVAATDYETGVISPGGVGYDINCGVRLLRSNLRKADLACRQAGLPAGQAGVEKRIRELVSALYRAIPTGVGSEGAAGKLSTSEIDRILGDGVGYIIRKGFGNADDQAHIEERGTLDWADCSAVSDHAKERGRTQLGSLGSGNHFLEVQTVEEIFDRPAAEAFGLEEGMVTVMIHSGSRGLGYQVCDDAVRAFGRIGAEKYGIDLPDRQLCSVPIRSPEGQQYLAAMAAAAHFAWSNRQVMTHVVRRVFRETLGITEERLGMDLVYDVCHNIAKREEHVLYTERGAQRRVEVPALSKVEVPALSKVEVPALSKVEVPALSKVEVCVHRKGATRAFPPGHPDVPDDYKAVGQPVLIPGDMGRASYVLKGTEKAMTETFGSSCHGAGRVMSRAASKKASRGRDVIAELKEMGTEVMARGMRTIAEEMPHAYKDISEVVQVMHDEGISLKVARLKPMGVIKG